MSDIQQRYLSPKDAAKYMGVSCSYLANARCGGNENAPPYIKVGTHMIRYDIEDLNAWADKTKRFCSGVDTPVVFPINDKPEPIEQSRNGFLYVVTNKLRHKIGITRKDPSFRLRQLQTGSPQMLFYVVLFEVESANEVEQQLHRIFKTKRLRGEWFKLSDVDISWLKDIEKDKFENRKQRIISEFSRVAN